MKKYLALIFGIIILSSLASAHFPEAHIMGTLKALETSPNSPSKDLCRSHLDYCLAGDMCGADSAVVYYLSAEGRGTFYQGTHTKKAVDKCFQLAGSDDRYRAFCTGWGLHLTQDPISHEGYTPVAIKKYLGTNLIVHPVVERAVVNNMLKSLPQAEQDRLKSLVQSNCDVFKTDPQLLQLLDNSAGVNLDSAVQIVSQALNGNNGYNADTIWGKKIDLPNEWYYYSAIPLAVSLLLFGLVLFRGRRFKKTLLIIYGIIIILSAIFLISILMKTSYVWFLSLSDFLGNFLTVSDWQTYMAENIAKSSDYLTSLELKVTDATGLTHFVGDTEIIGELEKAEKVGLLFWQVVGIVFVIVLLYLTIVSVFSKKR